MRWSRFRRSTGVAGALLVTGTAAGLWLLAPDVHTLDAELQPGPATADSSGDTTTGATRAPSVSRDGTELTRPASAPSAQPGATTPKTSTSSSSAAVRPTGIRVSAYVTAYSWHDNDPPGGTISDPVLHSTAGGTGSYADPITLAVAKGAYPPGTRLYLAAVRRYFIVEDTCAACGGLPVWVDMWLDGREASAAAVQDCASSLTGQYDLLLDPSPGLPVDAGPLYGSSGCYQER
jgi:hypothetical protein